MLDPKKLKYRPYSFSKISTHQQCPRKFKYFYIDKLPVPEEPQLHLDRGKFIHLLFEHDGDLKEVQKTKDWKEIKEHKLMTKEDIKGALNVYKQFKDSDTGKKLLQNESLLKEFPIGLNGNFEMVSYSSEDVVLRGYLDDLRTINDRTDVAMLIDWKTGHYKHKEEQNWSQLLWYSIALFKRNPELEKIMLVFAYVDHKKTNPKIVKREDLPRYENHLENQIKKIEEDTTFKKVESPLCNYCQFQKHCSQD